MAKIPIRFEKVDGLETLYTAAKGALRSYAIVLKDGGICLISPVAGLGEAARESLRDIGPVKVILAPNHYHNKGLAENAEAFPDAALCASERAIPRLNKITSLSLTDFGQWSPLLPDTMEILQPDGLKTGEIWIRINDGATTSWLVVDAFSGPKPDASGLPSTVPEMLKTFPNYGVGDRTAYSNWVAARIDKDQPSHLCPCHGAIVRAPDLAEKLRALIDERI